MQFVSLLLIFCTGIPFASAGEECGHLFVADRARLQRAIDLIFQRDESRDRATPLGIRDAGLVKWAGERMDKLPEGAIENVFRVLEDIRYGNNFLTPDGHDEDYLGNAAAMVRVSTDGPRLILNMFKAASEEARLHFVHEMTHLFRFVTNGALSESLPWSRALRGRYLGIYREEIYAFRAEYRYLRDTYTVEDLENLADYHAERDALLAGIKAVGLLSADGRAFDGDRLKEASVLHMFLQYMTADANADLHDRLKLALSSSESKYVKQSVAYYRDEQNRAHRQRLLRMRTWIYKFKAWRTKAS